MSIAWGRMLTPAPSLPPSLFQVNHPTVAQLTAIAANCFTDQDLLRMERVLLDTLDFNISNVTGFSFLHLFAQGLPGLTPAVAALAVYLLVRRRDAHAALMHAPMHAPMRPSCIRPCDPHACAHAAPMHAPIPPCAHQACMACAPMLTAPCAPLPNFKLEQELVLLDYSLLEFAPSQLAAAALAVAMCTHGQAAPLPRLLKLAGGAPADIARCARCLLQLHHNATWPQNQSVHDLVAPLALKYSQQPWCCAALVAPLPALELAW